MSPSQPTQPRWSPFWVPSSNSTLGLSPFINLIVYLISPSWIWTSFDRSLRHSLLVVIESTWSVSELPHIPIMYKWSCSISACTSIFFLVVFLVRYSTFVKWMAGSYISRTRNSKIPVLPIPAWSCHNNQCRVLSTNFYWVCNLSGSSLVYASPYLLTILLFYGPSNSQS